MKCSLRKGIVQVQYKLSSIKSKNEGYSEAYLMVANGDDLKDDLKM